uniref:hypothetical protein n=1 Tax=Actinotalea sp. C106 TaxID=2908644 RepID=UPI0020277DA9
MSYDLAVYLPRALEVERVLSLISQTPGLSTRTSSSPHLVLTVLRGARGKYCFTIEAPQRVEPDDVPIEVTSRLLGATHLHSVSVEGSSSTDVPHAIRFARRLARSLGGAVLDAQTGEVWPQSSARKVERPDPQKRVDMVELRWYCRPRPEAPDAIRVLLNAAARHLPEALPRRFGEYEPLQGKYADVGVAGLDAAWRAADGTFFIKGTLPVVDGSLDAPRGRDDPVLSTWHMSLDLLAEPLFDPRWREAVRRFFIDLADELRAFHATAEVTRGHLWTGSSARVDLEHTEWPIVPVRGWGAEWLGLSPTPTWWSWFGDPYRDLVAPHFSAGQVSETVRGLLQEWTTTPANREQLAPIVDGQIPADLMSTFAPNPARIVQPLPLAGARRIPDELGRVSYIRDQVRHAARTTAAR